MKNCSARYARCCPRMTRSTSRRSAISTPQPGTVLRSRDVELAFLGVISQPVKAVQLLYRTMDMNGEPEAAATTVIVPADLAPEQSLPAAVVPVRDRRHVVPLFSVLCAAAQGEGPRVGWPVRASPDRRRRRRGLGGLGARPRRSSGPVGCAVRTWLPCPRRHPGRSGVRTPRTVPRGADRAVGVLRWRTRQCLGGRNVRRVCARTGHRRGGAGITRRRPGQHLPQAQRRLPCGSTRVGGGGARPHLSRPGQGDQRAHQRGGAGPARVARDDDDRGSGRPDGRQEHGRLPRRAARGHPVDARGDVRLRQHQAGRRGARRRRC